MLTPLALSALGRELVIVIAGISTTQGDRLLDSWSWCGARRISDASVASAQHVLYAELREGISTPNDPPSMLRPDILASSFEELCERITVTITQSAIEKRKHDLLLLHAAGLSDPTTGATVALVGPSGRGKTTAAITLGRDLAYVTDETLAVDRERKIVPYPKPLSVKPGSSTPGWKIQTNPASVGLKRLGAPTPYLARILVLDRQPTVDAPHLEKVGLTEVLADVFGQISYLPARAQSLTSLQRLIAECGGLFRLTYSEATSLRPIVSDLLRGSRLVHGSRLPHGSPVRHGSPSAARAPLQPRGPGKVSLPSAACSADKDGESPRISRAKVEDWIVEGDSIVILRGSVVEVLDGLGAAIWMAAATRPTLDELAQGIVCKYGSPPQGNANELVADALDTLVDAGFVASSRAELG